MKLRNGKLISIDVEEPGSQGAISTGAASLFNQACDRFMESRGGKGLTLKQRIHAEIQEEKKKKAFRGGKRATAWVCGAVALSLTSCVPVTAQINLNKPVAEIPAGYR